MDGSRLAFLDEAGAKTNMTRLYARVKKGQRAVDFTPHGHWSTTTLVAALTPSGALAPMALDGAMDRLSFEAYVAQVLAPAIEPGTIVVMDNLSAHKSPEVARILGQAGAEVWYLPPYSPDFNPIELMWAKVKAALRSAKSRSQDALMRAIAAALKEIAPAESERYFCHCFVFI